MILNLLMLAETIAIYSLWRTQAHNLNLCSHQRSGHPHSITHFLTHSINQSLIYSLTHPLSHSLTHFLSRKQGHIHMDATHFSYNTTLYVRTSSWYVSARSRISVRLREAKSPVFRAKSATALREVSDGILISTISLDRRHKMRLEIKKVDLTLEWKRAEDRE